MALKFDEINISDGEWNATGLGIGTTSPATRLEVSSEGAHGILLSKDMTTPSNSGRLFFETDTVAEGWSFLNSNGLMTIRSGAQAGGTSGSVKMAMNTAGSVGIGTTTPSAKLHVNSSSDFLGYFKSTDNKVYVGIADNDTTFYISAENSLASIGPYTGLHVDNLNYDLVNKRLGIGTTSPSAKLDVVGTYKLNGQRGLSVRSIDESNYFSFNDESTAADFTQQLPKTGGSGTVTKVDDSTAPAEGCFEVTGNYYSDIHTDNRYVKVDINAEYTWEMYVKFVSGTDTSQTIYLGWGAWDANKTYFGNTQRYWGASAAQVDADSNNSDWVLIRGTISGVGTGNGKFIAGTEYVAPVVLLNYNSNANVIRVCGLKLYKSSKSATKIQLGRSGASSSAVFNVNTEYPASRVTLENSGADGMRVRNDHGYLEIGSLNSGHAHIQTDRTNFYFNKRILVDEGIISSYNEDLTLQTSQATRLVIKSDTGNVGINTTSPQAKLDVEPGDVGTNSGDSVTAAIIRAGRQNVHFLTERTASGSDWNNNTFKILAKIDSTSHQSINFVNDVSYNEHIDIYTGNQLFSTRFNANGNVGIGTTAPTSKLTVTGGGGSTTPTLALNSNTSHSFNHGINSFNSSLTAGENQIAVFGKSGSSYNSGYIGYKYNAANSTSNLITIGHWSANNLVNIDGNGNVGIGTESPSAKLEVKDSANNIQMRVGSLTAGISPLIRLQGKNTANTLNYYADIKLDAESGKLLFNDPGTSSGSIGQNPMVLDSNGNVGIGTTSPSTKLHVSGTATATSFVDSTGYKIPNATDMAVALGWEPAYSNSTYSSIRYNDTQKAIELQSDSDGSTGAAFKAVRIRANETKRFTVMVKASVAASGGLYLRLYGINGDLPNGKTHISGSGGSSFVEAPDYSQSPSWEENRGVSTSWTTYEYSYTAAADGYISLVVLNWTGIGTNSLYIRQPDIQTQSGVQTWSGTKAQYDALTADANTIYYITDE